MTFIVNGKPENNEFGDFEIETLIQYKIVFLTDELNEDMLEKLSGKTLSEDSIIEYYKFETRSRASLGEIEQKYIELYEMEISSYRAYVKNKFNQCEFSKINQGTSASDPAKCRLSQVDAGVASTFDAIFLANRTKFAIYVVISTRPYLKKHFIKMFKGLETWDINAGNLDAFLQQLSNEIDLVDSDLLSQLFRSFLREIKPRLERRLLAYDGCETFGQRRCVLCLSNFERKNFMHTPEPFTKDPCNFYFRVFRKRFYNTLVAFLIVAWKDSSLDR